MKNNSQTKNHCIDHRNFQNSIYLSIPEERSKKRKNHEHYEIPKCVCVWVFFFFHSLLSMCYNSIIFDCSFLFIFFFVLLLSFSVFFFILCTILCSLLLSAFYFISNYVLNTPFGFVCCSCCCFAFFSSVWAHIVSVVC